MKKVETIITPFRIDDVRDALTKIGIRVMTMSEVRVPGEGNEYPEYYRGRKYEPAFITKTKIELAVHDEDLEIVLAVIENSEGGTVDGNEKIFVYSLDDTVKPGKKVRSVAAI